jgi:membrane protease YdiL (CAAX protease family)
MDWQFIIVIILVFAGSYFGLSKLNDAFVSIFERFGYVPDELKLPQKTPINVIAAVVFVAVLPAVCEEFLFRGLILNSTKWLGGMKAVLISAGFFCIYHMSPYQTAYQFVMGVIYGIVALKAQSITPTIILHFLNNLLVILWYYFFPNWVIGDTWQVVLTILGIAGLAVAIYLCFVFGKKQTIKTPLEKPQKLEFAINVFPGIFLCLVFWISNLFI